MARTAVKVEEKQVVNTSKVARPVCGIVMPISAIDSCSEKHWEEVKSILTDAIQSAGYEAKLVSDADDIGIIQKRIVQNLYENDIVVCDVSCKNANVMFELGLRLAFDKPTIIVSDEKTNYSFDTSIIEHLIYPRDLSYFSIIDFKEKLKSKIEGTIKKYKEDPSYSPFLKNFGKFKVATIEDKEVSMTDAILEKLGEMQSQIYQLSNRSHSSIFAKNRETEPEDVTNMINSMVQRKISDFIKESGISMDELYMNNYGEKDKLQSYLERDPALCGLCKNANRMRSAIDENVYLLPF